MAPRQESGAAEAAGADEGVPDFGEAAGAVRAEARWALDWLLGQVFPLWAERGVDRVGGGFFEKLDLVTVAPVGEERRLRVQSRQTFAFGEAALLGFGGGREVMAHGFDFLFRRARLPEGHHAILFGRGGEVRDAHFDLYETAFVLLALAQGFRITGDAALRDEALRVLGLLHERLGHPDGGFREGAPPRPGYRRQNPHMHLFEAAMAWMAADPAGESGSPSPFTDLARHLHGLFETRFFDRGAGVLREHFRDDLGRLRAFEGRLVEPGHHFEWVWLLGRWRKLTGIDSPAMVALAEFAEAHGISASNGTAVEEVLDDGTPHSPRSRFWPQTERLKAAIALAERAPSPAATRAIVASARQMRRFIDASPTPGLWCEPLGPDGRFSRDPVPASTLYHIVLAYSELARHAGIR